MYAGAAREAVFAVPAVIKKIKADYVPLALRAPAVNMPQSVPDDNERWLYERINRAKIAPQGICVLDARGQVLTWVQMFEDDKSVLDFLDHGKKRFQDRPAATERFMKFPGAQLPDYQDNAAIPPIMIAHEKGKRCAAEVGKNKLPAGALRLRVVGRALDDKGKPVADVVKQERYIEDQFGISADLQKTMVTVVTDAGKERVRLPDEFSKACAEHAHLGHIDVQPCICMIKGRAENKGEWKRCEFFAKKEKANLWRIDGVSEVVSEVAINGKGLHNVKLAWEGFIEFKDKRVTRVVLSARGTEKLQFAKDDHPLLKLKKDEVAFLPAGRPVNIECGVRYGIVSE